MRALGVYREPEFSPGKVEHDAAILDAVMAELKRHGLEISVMSAAGFVADPLVSADLVLAMCQGERALGRLVALEQQGAVAVNSRPLGDQKLLKREKNKLMYAVTTIPCLS